MYFSHEKNKFPRRPYRTTNKSGEVVVVWFERNPNKLFMRKHIEEFEFQKILIRLYDYRVLGCGRKRLQKLLEIKVQWETGVMTAPQYFPSPDLLSLGRTLDLTKGEISFTQKNYSAYPQLR